MKSFTKIIALFVFTLTLIVFVSPLKATGISDEAHAPKIQLRGSNHIKAGNSLTAELTSATDAKAEFVVENAAGQRFADKKLAVDAGSNLVKFNVSEVPAGIYFIKVKVDGIQQTATFVVY